MRWIALVAVLSLAMPAFAEDEGPFDLKDVPTVTSAADVEKLPKETEGVKIFSFPHLTMKALVERLPNLKGLHVTHPGNNIDKDGFVLLERFEKLETFVLEGDPFLYDEEFALIGRMTSIRDLRMSLP